MASRTIMADIDTEEMKSLFQTLAERLDNTKGDSTIQAEMVKMRAVMDRMVQLTTMQINNKNKSTDTLISELIKETKSSNIDRKTIIGGLGEQREGTIINDLRREKEGLDKSTVNLEKNVKKAGDATDKFAKNTNDAAEKLTQGFLTSLASMGVAGYSFISEQAEYYRALKASGDGSIGSIQEMNNVALEARMSTKEFAEALSKGSTGLRQLGGAKFAELSGLITRSTAATGNMALSFTQRMNELPYYMDILSSTGRLQNTSIEKMNTDFQRLIRSSETTANILGLTREEALKMAAKNSQDALLTVVMNSMGLNNIDNINSEVLPTFEKMWGEEGNRLFKQLMINQTPTDEGTIGLFATMGADIQSALMSVTDRARRGEEVSGKEVARIMKAASEDFAKGRGSAGTLAQIGLANTGKYSQALNLNAQGAINSQSFNTDDMVNKLGNEGTQAALGLEESQRSLEISKNAALYGVMNETLDIGSGILKTFNKSAIDASDALVDLSQTIQGSPIGSAIGGTALAIGGLGLAIGGVSALLVGLGKVTSFLSGGMLTFGRFFGGGSSGAAGSGGSGGAAGGIAGFNPSKMMKGTAAIAGLLETAQYALGMKDFNFENITRSGFNVAGSALGALAVGGAGSLVAPGVGTVAGGIAGGIGGGIAGDKLGDYIFGEKKEKKVEPENKSKETLKNISDETKRYNDIYSQREKQSSLRDSSLPNYDRRYQKDINNTTGNSLTPKPTPDNSLLTQTNGYLKKMELFAETSSKQNDDQFAMLKDNTERLIRILEETNRLTKQILQAS